MAKNSELIYLNKYIEVFTVVCMTFVILIFGEITPKTLALANPIPISLKVIGFINKLYKLFFPVYKIVGKISELIINKISFLFVNDKLKLNEEELKLAIDLGLTDGALTPEEEKMIKRVFELTKTRVEEIMTPKPDIKACSDKWSLKEIIEMFNKTSLSRMPVYSKNMNNIIGIVYKKDLFLNFTELRKGNNWQRYIRPAFFVPENKMVASLLKNFKIKRQHIAVVVDEYGGVSGIVTFKDLTEEIFGEILDKNDSDDCNVKKIGLFKHRISGRMPIDYFNEIFKTNISEEESITISGYIMETLGRMPVVNDELDCGSGFKLTVEKIEGKEIKFVKVEKING